MKQTKIMMDMPITVEIIDSQASKDIFRMIFSYFEYIDKKFSIFLKNSEITKINEGRIQEKNYSQDMKNILSLSGQTRQLTNGYFDINHRGKLDPSGIVKGWAIYNVSKILRDKGFKNFYVDAGGDIQTSGKKKGSKWKIGIRNPFHVMETVKTVYLNGEGIATSGNYYRGSHIYNPRSKHILNDDIVSFTIIAPNIYEADRFATAAFAMGEAGIRFIDKLDDLEGYMIKKDGKAIFTSGFEEYTTNI